MMRLYFVFVFSVLISSSWGQQNLIFNPSFEDSRERETGIYDLEEKKSILPYWFTDDDPYPLVFQAPEEYVAEARDGRHTLGMFIGYPRYFESNSYLSGSLRKALEPGAEYCFCLSILLHRTSILAARDVGVLFHPDKDLIAASDQPLDLSASIYFSGDKALSNTKWQQYCARFTASGGERYLSLGKFGHSRSDTMRDLGLRVHPEADGFHTQAFYHFDQLSLRKIGPTDSCGCAQKVPAPNTPPKPYIFVLDASESMRKKGRYDSLRLSLSHFLDSLPPGLPVSFTSFASGASLLYSGYKDEHTARQIDQALQAEKLQGSTNVLEGLTLGSRSMKSEVQDSARLVLISDGRFRVSPELIALLKMQNERYARKLTFLQVDAKARGLQQLQPYLDFYSYSESPRNISGMIRSLERNNHNLTAEACPCEVEAPDTVNYHFVVDYSGSMAEENSAALQGFYYLFGRVPPQAFVSITLFNHEAAPIYQGPRMGITAAKAMALLAEKGTLGGTKPIYGLDAALKIASEHTGEEENVLLILTDLAAIELTANESLSGAIVAAQKDLNLAVSVLHFYQAEYPSVELRTTNSHFDAISETFYTVTRARFEQDLFELIGMNCDYRSEHYRKGKRKGLFLQFLQEAQRESDPRAYDWR